ncbi:hypothetical protein BO99DRAFT_415695 [Aspergillus violaceofuscus CBS 115571]|uniref:Uncharacterized protein n=1 Tax=Aspergillus violaceofuscus (strain CBS 115571) TaxID=1450538 RepID=A0A2V5H4G5_ASPV1|nr:hypothetical protein BO99DRAFT_415695 [Aspergillus violaceofuscus CBS 115571]
MIWAGGSQKRLHYGRPFLFPYRRVQLPMGSRVTKSGSQRGSIRDDPLQKTKRRVLCSGDWITPSVRRVFQPSNLGRRTGKQLKWLCLFRGYQKAQSPANILKKTVYPSAREWATGSKYYKKVNLFNIFIFNKVLANYWNCNLATKASNWPGTTNWPYSGTQIRQILVA